MATVTIKNVDRLIQRLNKIADMDLKEKMVQATKVVHAQAKALAPVDTGNLAGSIHMKVNKKGENIEGRVYTNVQYAPYVEFGTGIKGNGSYPCKVESLNLSYHDTPWVFTPDGGKTFYRTKGQVAQPFMYPALKQNEKYIKQLFKDGVKDNLSKNCKGGR